VQSVVPIFQFIGTSLGGSLGDRVDKRLIAGIAMLVHSAALLLLTWSTHRLPSPRSS